MPKDLKGFPRDYYEGKKNFLKALKNSSYLHEQYEIGQLGKDGENLTIDIGLRGLKDASRTVVISSGLHGVEGYLGSAIQSNFLNDVVIQSLDNDTNVVIIHALNPFGFSWNRRCNEDNIDLNRNFLLENEKYEGSPINYGIFNDFLNPESAPSKHEPFLIKVLLLIIRYGFTTLMNTFPEGQYDYPKGLFFGGQGKSKTQEILSQNLPRLIGSSSQITHIDLHTGLGRLNTYKLLVDETNEPGELERLAKRFEIDNIEVFNKQGSAYKVRGGIGKWCKSLFPNCKYDFLTAEFGTYSAIKILKALRAENRSYWWAKPSINYEWTRSNLSEMFAPINEEWRDYSVREGLNICRKACLSE